MPDNNLTDGSVFTSSFYNTNIREQVIATVTSSTRPSHAEGRVIYETDTGKFMVSNGTGWRLFGGSDWEDFTPNWTNLSVGNGTNTGNYRYVQGGMWFSASIEFGSTTSISGSVAVTVPNSETISTAGGWSVGMVLGQADFNDATGSDYVGAAIFSSTTTVGFRHHNAGILTALSSSVPFTWATSDKLRVGLFVPL